MYRKRNGQNVYRTVKERIYRSQQIKQISSHTCIGHEVIMHKYVNKIICILSYNKTNRTVYMLSLCTMFFKSRIFRKLGISNC